MRVVVKRKVSMQAKRRLQEGDGEGTSSDDHLGSEGGNGSSASVGDDGRSGGSVHLGAVGSTSGGTTSRGLDLTVGDLSDLDTSGSRSLDLAVRDLSDGSTGGGCLDLTVGDLGDLDGGGGRSLDLAVGDLSDGNATSRGLNLAIGDLGDRSASGCLDLTIRDLSDRAGGGRGLELTIANLGGGTASTGNSRGGRTTSSEDVDVDGRALVASGLVVQVVEVAAQALVEDGRVADGKGAVAADGEARGVDSTSLSGLVELELVVGSNVTGTALIVSQDTVGEGDGEDLVLTSLKITLGVGGDVSNRDGEGTVEAGRAALRSGLLGSNGLVDTLGEGNGGTGKGSGNGEGLHIDGDDDVDGKVVVG